MTRVYEVEVREGELGLVNPNEAYALKSIVYGQEGGTINVVALGGRITYGILELNPTYVALYYGLDLRNAVERPVKKKGEPVEFEVPTEQEALGILAVTYFADI